MNEGISWKSRLEECVRQGDPEKAKRCNAWKIAIGLQDVDGLIISESLFYTAMEHIKGKIDIDTVRKQIKKHYKKKEKNGRVHKSTKQADIVSTEIAALLIENNFDFSINALEEIHRCLFSDVLKNAGETRPYDITKKEWVLGGKTVIYTPCDSIIATLDNCLKAESKFNYTGLPAEKVIKHISEFASALWIIHPFFEGNTRTVAVFIISYLKSLGFDINSDVFAKHSWYFRNALVRANYTDTEKDIFSTCHFLELFFENLLFKKEHLLKNSFMRIGS